MAEIKIDRPPLIRNNRFEEITKLNESLIRIIDQLRIEIQKLEDNKQDK